MNAPMRCVIVAPMTTGITGSSAPAITSAGCRIKGSHS
jgi:hypothetical protein